MPVTNVKSAWSSGNLVFSGTGKVQFNVDGGIELDGSTATATAGAATLSKQAGVITTAALTTAAGAAYTLTLTNTLVAATSLMFASVQNGTNSQGVPRVGLITPGAGSATIQVYNDHASLALNGTLKISFLLLNTV